MAHKVEELEDWTALTVGDVLEARSVHDPNFVMFPFESVYVQVNPAGLTTDLVFLTFRPNVVVNRGTVESVNPVKVSEDVVSGRPQLVQMTMGRANHVNAIQAALSILRQHMTIIPDITKKQIEASGFLVTK